MKKKKMKVKRQSGEKYLQIIKIICKCSKALKLEKCKLKPGDIISHALGWILTIKTKG
jgi:hypothetical protein